MHAMHIDAYSFGSITVDGKIYKRDVIVFPQTVRPDWWRKEGHSLAMEDLDEVIAFEPDILVVGIGALGIMRIPSSTKSAIEKQGIRLFGQKTADAVDLFNEHIGQGEKVVGAFHLTC